MALTGNPLKPYERDCDVKVDPDATYIAVLAILAGVMKNFKLTGLSKKWLKK